SMKPTALLCLVTMLTVAPCAAWPADAGSKLVYEKRTELAQRRFGEVRFVMGAGRAMKWLEMYSGTILIAAFREFDADEVVASPDGQYFLALSNCSNSSLAFAVIDRNGLVVVSNPHGGTLHYCRRTNWGIGEWVDTRVPHAKFTVERNQLATPATQFLSVSVRGCDGKTVLLGPASTPERKVAGGNHPVVPAPQVNTDGQARGVSFIGNTIANLRGLDPTFGDRTLTLIDGRRSTSPP